MLIISGKGFKPGLAKGVVEFNMGTTTPVLAQVTDWTNYRITVRVPELRTWFIDPRTVKVRVRLTKDQHYNPCDIPSNKVGLLVYRSDLSGFGNLNDSEIIKPECEW